jgi:hypothetical protein
MELYNQEVKLQVLLLGLLDKQYLQEIGGNRKYNLPLNYVQSCERKKFNAFPI